MSSMTILCSSEALVCMKENGDCESCHFGEGKTAQPKKHRTHRFFTKPFSQRRVRPKKRVTSPKETVKQKD